MATFAKAQSQSTGEAYTYTVDFTNDLPSGGTVSAGTATHIPPSGAASTLVTSIDSPYVYVEVPKLTVTGVHYVDVVATINGDATNQASVRIPINIVYPSTTARSGMLDLVSQLRELTEAGSDDYKIAGVPYWDDRQLQRVLDAHRYDLKYVEMTAWEEGDATYLEYAIGYGHLEQTTGGTAIFFVQDVSGATVSSSGYSVDYDRGVVTFNADTLGVPYYVTGRSYDLEGAAADVWRRKLSHYASTSFDFSTDNHTINRSQLYQHAAEMVKHFEQLSESGFSTVYVSRSDTDD